MGDYAVYLHERVLARAPRSGAAREKLMKFIHHVAADPHRKGDYRTRDEVGHELEVAIVGSYAVTYWADHAVKEVKIINLMPADEA
jgi:hypothetical protein